MFGRPLSRTTVSSAMIVKVGAAAKRSHLAMAGAATTPSSSKRVPARAGRGHAFAPASRLRNAASPASDTSTHLGSGAALGM